MNALKKIAKFLAWTIGIVLVLVIALALTIPWWLGPTVKGVANKFGPSIVKTDLHLGDFYLNPYQRLFHTGDFQLSNPTGFDERYAVKLGELRVELAPEVISNNVIHIKLIRVKDVFVSYCFNYAFESNFSVLAEAMEGEDDESDEVKEVKAEREVEKRDEGEVKGEGMKVIIDRMEIEGVVAKIGKVSLPLTPKPLVFEDIGKKSGGQTLAEVYDSTIGPLIKATDPAVETLEMSVKLAVSGVNQGLDLGKQGVDAATEGLGKAVDAIKLGDVKGAKETLKATKETLKATGKGLKGVGKELEDLFK